jgi:SAM-dependent MidA family methyltransferase
MQTAPADATAYLPQANAVQRLVSPAEMGDLFKVMAFAKGDVAPIAGYGGGDRRHSL